MLDRTTEIMATAELTLTAGDLHDALRRVRHAICKEEIRYYLNGVYVHHVARNNVLRFVATDGHRLAQMDVPAPEGADTLRPAILSREFVADVIKATNKRGDAFKHVRLAIGPIHVRLTDWDGNTVEGALIDGTFPDDARVVPRGEPPHGTVTLARKPFLRAVAAATAFAQATGDNRAALRFAFAGDALTISAAFDACGSACHGSATITVNIAASTMAEPQDVGLCGPQVLDILRSLRGRQVRFDFFDIGGPNNFAGDEADGSALHVIMPVRV
jgi:DNA polymerase-3 subunit beta